MPRDSAQLTLPHFTARRKWVRYGGRRWRLVQDRGRWLLVMRGRGHICLKWIPAECAQ